MNPLPLLAALLVAFAQASGTRETAAPVAPRASPTGGVKSVSLGSMSVSPPERVKGAAGSVQAVTDPGSVLASPASVVGRQAGALPAEAGENAELGLDSALTAGVAPADEALRELAKASPAAAAILKAHGAVNFDHAGAREALVADTGIGAIDKLKLLFPIDLEAAKKAARVEDLRDANFLTLWDFLAKAGGLDLDKGVALGSYQDGTGLYAEAVDLTWMTNWRDAYKGLLRRSPTEQLTEDFMKALTTQRPQADQPVVFLLTSQEAVARETGRELEWVRRNPAAMRRADGKRRFTIVVGDMGALPKEKLHQVHRLLRQLAYEQETRWK